MEKTQSICFAYFADGKFIGWYAGTMGGCTPTSPKIYSNTESQKATIQKNLTYKLRRINETSFDEQRGSVTGLAALSLATFDSEELLRGKEVELRIVECPEYDGPNPNFDEEKYTHLCDERTKKMTEDGVFDIPAPSKERSDAVDKYPSIKCDNWIYADYAKVKEWAQAEPTEFIGIIKPENSISIGDTVRKISGKPFKSGGETDEVIGFLPNSQDPKNRMGAKLKESDTIVNFDLLIKVS